MGWEAWLTLAVVAVVFVALVKEWSAPDVVLVAGTLVLTLAGVIRPEDAFRGFANEAMLTVAALFVVVAAMRETGALDVIGTRMLGKAGTAESALVRLAVSMNTVWLFLNNTAVVAMLLPVVTDWCRKRRVSPSRLLIPLSYFSILRGMVTLIGTSTNLVVSGLMIQVAASQTDPRVQHALRPVQLFEITPLGLACTVVGTLFLLLAGRKLLPDRKDLIEQLSEHSREYLVDMLVQPGCRLIGKSVEEAGLRQLPGLFLIEISRDNHLISPVSPDEILEAEDRLTFTGVVGSIVELERIPGLVPAADEAYETSAARRRGRRLCEAVISKTSPLIGKTIREADFRALYNAAVVAVHRAGARLTGRIGDIVLHMGDTLLLQTGAHFARAHRNDPDFILVSGVEEWRPVRHDRAGLALTILVLMVAAMVFGGSTFRFASLGFQMPAVVISVFTAAVLLIVTRCISAPAARESIDWETLIAIAASFGLGKALETSGAAGAIAGVVVDAAGAWGPIAILGAIYLLTLLFTELITNNAAAAIMLPFGLAVAAQLGVSPRPFAIAIMFGASLAFAVPIGYQTHMMVYSPGGYRFSDFVRLGVPLNILLWILATLLIPIIWPFHRF
jgi:di/tricarboxylate transporter